MSPVAADLSVVVEEKEKADPNAFGPGGAYAQAFALFNCSMAAATLFGPVAAAALRERYDWGVMSAATGAFALSGAVPTVGVPPARCDTGAESLGSFSIPMGGFSGRKHSAVSLKKRLELLTQWNCEWRL